LKFFKPKEKVDSDLKTILYIGNKLVKHGLNQTSIETLGPLLEKEGYQLIYASSKKSKILRMLEMLWVTVSNSRKTDYVLIDTYSTYNFWYAFIISQTCGLLRLKYIPKLHGGDLPKRLDKNPYLSKLIFNFSYLNIAPSAYLLNAFRDAGFKNTIYIPNTIEICNYQFAAREIMIPKLLWVRSFSPIYNPEMALEVLKIITETYPKAELCMVGPDKNGLLEKMKELAAQYEIHVTFTGRLTKEDWTKLAEDYNIFINTTHFDNTPVSVIEAMALGLPVISTNVGGIPYLLEDKITALLIDDNDTKAMAAAVIELLQNEVLKNNIVKNAHQMVQEFDSEKVKLQWVEILK